MKFYNPLLALLLLSVTSFSQKKSSIENVGKTTPLIDTNINWEEYDTSSTILQNNISIENLKGTWKAHQGVFRFNNVFNQMNLTTPFVIQIKKDGIKRNKKDPFDKLTLQENRILIVQKNSIDTGIVNKLTPTELTITWKKGLNYTRYFYKK